MLRSRRPSPRTMLRSIPRPRLQTETADMNKATDAGQTLRVQRVLQRVVFPAEDLDVVPLYVETNIDRGVASMPTASAAAVGETQSSVRFGADVPAHLVEEVGPRRSAVISPGRRVSFAPYFNAFPASYWRRWTTVSS